MALHVAHQGHGVQTLMVIESVTYEPLDYTFKELATCDDIVKEEPRKGHRYNPNETKEATQQVTTAARPHDNKHAYLAPRVHSTVLVNAIRLSYNKLENLSGFEKAVSQVIREPQSIGWIDLSFNHLTNIERVLVNFKNVSVLYLHANRLERLADIDKLAELPHLRTLTLHGNPIEHVKGYRIYVLSKIPTLHTLDYCSVSRQERLESKLLREKRAQKSLAAANN